MLVIDRQSYGENRDSSRAQAEDAKGEHLAANSDSPNNRFAQWFREWRKPVRHWLSRRAAVPAAELDDLAQEVFLRLLRYSEKTAVENPLGYLLRIAGNVASEWRERARVSKPHEQDWLDELLIEPDQEPQNSVSQARTDESVQEAVDRLPRRQRDVLLLRVNEGLTYKQIADRLNLTPRVVLRDLTRAYSQLRMQLDPDDLK
jgi:RNA polymerase sigma factor (sigma-70 family)